MQLLRLVTPGSDQAVPVGNQGLLETADLPAARVLYSAINKDIVRGARGLSAIFDLVTSHEVSREVT